MEKLTSQDETQVWLFRTILDQVITLGDMFPPDNEASLVPARPREPRLSGGAVCALEFQMA